MKRLFIILALALAVFGGYRAWEEWQALDLAQWLNGELGEAEAASRQGVALKMTGTALESLKAPTVFAFITSADVQAILQDKVDQESLSSELSGWGTLEVDEAQVELGEGLLTLRLGFRAELSKQPISVEGSLALQAVPAFDGASIALVPLGLTPDFDRIRVSGLEDRRILPKVLGAALGPLWRAYSDRLGRLTLPIPMGLDEPIDLQAQKASKELDLSIRPSSLPLRAVLSEAAVLVQPEGLLILGEAEPLAEEQILGARAGLEDLAKQIREIPQPEPCRHCRFEVSDLGGYLGCWTESAQCRTDRAFETLKADSHRVLEPVELTVLSQLRDSTSDKDRQIFQELGFLLSPRWTETEKKPWNPQTIADLNRVTASAFYSKAVSLDSQFSESPTQTTIAFSRRLLGDVLQSVMATTAIQVSAKLKDQVVPIEQDFRTDPAPNLNCGENARKCPSKFKFRPYRPRKCPSKCNKLRCVRVFGKKICTKIPDLKCSARKLDCEGLKLQEKIAYDAEKESKHAVWHAERMKCQALRELELTGCELNQGWLNHWGKKKLGRVKGHVDMSKIGAEALISDFEIEPDFQGFSFSTRLAGSTHASAHYKLEPLGEGYLACLKPWKGKVDADFHLQPVDLDVRGALEVGAEGEDLWLRAPERSVTLRMSPAPSEILVEQMPKILESCPVAGLAAGALMPVARVTGLLKIDISDELEAKLPAQEIRIPLARNIPLAGSVVSTQLTPKTVISTFESKEAGI